MQQTGYKTQRQTGTIYSPRKSIDLYSSIGRIVPSQRPTAPQYSMGKAKKSSQKKMFINQQFAKVDMRGTSYTAAPNSYFPSTTIKSMNGKNIMTTLVAKDLDMKYQQPKRTIIGDEQRGWKNTFYKHYENANDLQLNEADKKIKNNNGVAVMGTQSRFVSQYPGNKPTPSPFVYEPAIGTNFNNPPKYSFARRVQSQKKLSDDFRVPTPKKRRLNSKLNGPSPATYFTEQSKLNKTRSQSVNFLRVPENSHMKSTTAHKFPLSHRSSLAQKRSGYTQETFDIKTQTIMNHYDFENDGGKGHHTGMGWLKQTIDYHSKIPENRNKMRSYSIGKTQRGQASRGTFQAHMEFKPASVRIAHPKF